MEMPRHLGSGGVCHVCIYLVVSFAGEKLELKAGQDVTVMQWGRGRLELEGNNGCWSWSWSCWAGAAGAAKATGT